MIEITNRTKSPVQIMVRSKTASRAFTTMNIPGIGKGKNVCRIEDEMWTDQIKRIADTTKSISIRQVPNQLS